MMAIAFEARDFRDWQKLNPGGTGPVAFRAGPVPL